MPSIKLPVDLDVISPHPLLRSKDREESDFTDSQNELLLVLRVQHSPLHHVLCKYIFENKSNASNK